MESRRSAIKKMAWAGIGCMAIPSYLPNLIKEPWFKISLAEWSLHKKIRAGELKNIHFPEYTKREFGISAVEYVSVLFPDNGLSKSYLSDLKSRCDGEGIKSLLIMIDAEGHLGNGKESERVKAVENHHKWIEAANYLGCHSIRVNAAGNGSRSEVKSAAVNSLSELGLFAKEYKINVIVENHGGYSSDAGWLSSVMKQVNMGNVGTLPDFGNFHIDREKGIEYDKYKGVKELMPFAKAVSAKCYHFEDGAETTIDYPRMMQIVKDAGYTGYVGIEYEGNELSEDEGIKACYQVLMKLSKA